MYNGTSLYSTEPCKCAGVVGKYNDGAKCKSMSGYEDEWYNGVWCFAKITACKDAKEHAWNSLPGYGGSRTACASGIHT